MALPTLKPSLGLLEQRTALPPPKVADEVYVTPEHRAWRAAVYERARGRCQWPGCGRQERRMFADHIIELKDKGARLDPANGQLLCGSHHTRKTIDERTKRDQATTQPKGGGGD